VTRAGVGTQAAVTRNIEALRPVYAEWGRGNWRPRPDVYADEMEWGWSDEFPGLGGVLHDPALRNQRLREWLSPWEEWRCEAEDYVAAGDSIVVLCRYSGKGKGSGVEVETRGAHVWKMRDGMALRIEIFSSRARAFQAAGLDQGQADP
jgi:uncharacterized protein